MNMHGLKLASALALVAVVAGCSNRNSGEEVGPSGSPFGDPALRDGSLRDGCKLLRSPGPSRPRR